MQTIIENENCMLGLLNRMKQCKKEKDRPSGHRERRAEIPLAPKLPVFPPLQTVIAGQWTLMRLLYSSKKSQVYLAHANNGEEVAVKVTQDISVNEVQVYGEFHYVSRDWGIAQVFHHNVGPVNGTIVMDYLGPSLKSVIGFSKTSFMTMKEILQITFQLLYRLETVHNTGIIHGNIEPENILVGRGDRQSGTVYLIGFSNATCFRRAPRNDSPSHMYKRPQKTISLTFASVRQHEHQAPSKKDDLESLVYVIAYMLKRRLPWEDLMQSDANSPSVGERVRRMKMGTDPLNLFSGQFKEFIIMHRYVMALKEGDRPDYHRLRLLLRKNFNRLK